MLSHYGILVYQKETVIELSYSKKKALCIILGTVYIDNRRHYKFNGEHLSYHDALKKLSLITLNERRVALTNKFAIETARNEKHNDIFIKKQSKCIITRNMYVLKEQYC